MIDFTKLLDGYKKKKTIFLILIIVLSVLFVYSTLMFIFLSNYKVQIIMSVCGSIANSILLVALVYIILGLYLPTISLDKFYKMVNNLKQEEFVTNDVYLVGSYTIRRYVSLPKYYVNDREYYLLDDGVELKKGIKVIAAGNYILGVKDESI